MKSRKKIATTSKYVGNIGVIPHEDKMVYENLDNNDQVYVGNVDSNNKIDKIYYGKLGGDWQSLPLSTPVSKTDLFVTANGKVYINDKIKSTVTELQTRKETTYKGILLQLYNDGIASLSDGNLVKTPFN